MVAHEDRYIVSRFVPTGLAGHIVVDGTAKGYALVVGAHFNVHPVVASVVLGEVKRGGIVVVGNHRLFAPKVRDDGTVHGSGDSHSQSPYRREKRY